MAAWDNEFDRRNQEELRRRNEEFKRQSEAKPQYRLSCVNGSCGMNYVSDRPHYGDKCPRCSCVMNCSQE
jgi:hypothetical protein